MPIQPEAPAPQSTLCDGCGVTDTLPKHHIALGMTENGLAVASLHFACCRARGCPDRSCNLVLAGAQ